MPSSLSVIKGLILLINSIMMFLSDLFMSESLKPGVSMSFMKLSSAILTQCVTACVFCPLWNSKLLPSF